MTLDFDSMLHALKPLHPAATPVVAFLKERLEAAIRGADPDVRGVFFPDAAGADAEHGSSAVGAELRALAVKYASWRDRQSNRSSTGRRRASARLAGVGPDTEPGAPSVVAGKAAECRKLLASVVFEARHGRQVVGDERSGTPAGGASEP